MLNITANKTLSWQQITVVPLAFALSLAVTVAGITDFGPAPAHRPHPLGLVLSVNASVVLLAAAIAGLLLWHHKRANQPDIHPDILRQLTDPNSIYQQGPVHFTTFTCPTETGIRLIVLLQNKFNSPCTFVLKFTPADGSRFLAHPPKNLRLSLEGSAVCVATSDLSCLPGAQATIRLQLTAEIPQRTRGRQVRFFFANGISRQTSTSLAAGLAVTGVLMTNRGGASLTFNAANPTSHAGPNPSWKFIDLWLPHSPADLPTIQALLDHFISLPTETPANAP